MILHEHADLSGLNTFGLPGRARWLAQVSSAQELQSLVQDKKFSGVHRQVLGGGSNIVLRVQEINALLIKLNMFGWRVVDEQHGRVRIEANAGMAWHDLVADCVAAGYGGIENLALIPGTVGAAPIQNIGAYGVELESVLYEVDTIDLLSGASRTFSRAECAFAYRDSLFKHAARHFAITAIRLDLALDAPLLLGYRDLQDEWSARGRPVPSHRLVFDMVCAIRRRKLPDPAVQGNAGSFFRNPVLSAVAAAALQAKFPDIVTWPQADGTVKVAAAWLIDRAGWKGYREAHVGVHAQQALVLVNTGGATGADVLALAERIVASVLARYGVELQMEPEVL